MAVSLELKPNEFTLRGGMMEKTFICEGLSVVGAKKFVKMGKTMRWVTFFATGEGHQQSPLTSSKVLCNIRQQAKARAIARLAEIRDADRDDDEAEVEDLSNRLGLGAIGLADEDEPDDELVLSKQSMKLLPPTMKVPLTLSGVPADWAPVFVVDGTLGTRMELNEVNMTNLFAAFEHEKPVRAAVVKKKKRAVTPKRKAKASPKKKATSPLPDNSPTSGNRRYDYKGVGVVRVLKGDKVGSGVRTPRRIQVVTRKRPAGCKHRPGEMSDRTYKHLNKLMDEYSGEGSDEDVFDKDSDPKMDSD